MSRESACSVGQSYLRQLYPHISCFRVINGASSIPSEVDNPKWHPYYRTCLQYAFGTLTTSRTFEISSLLFDYRSFLHRSELYLFAKSMIDQIF